MISEQRVDSPKYVKLVRIPRHFKDSLFVLKKKKFNPVHIRARMSAKCRGNVLKKNARWRRGWEREREKSDEKEREENRGIDDDGESDQFHA